MSQLKVLSPKELLDEMENTAVEAAQTIMASRDMLAIAVHKIYSEQLFLEHKDDNGIPEYPNQAAYEPFLLQKMGISRATLYNVYTPLKIAAGPTFGLDYDEFVETGGVTTWSAVKNNVNYNRFTGEVTEIKGGTPEGADVKVLVMDAVHNVAPKEGLAELNLLPGEVHKEIDKVVGNKPVITFSVKVYEDGRKVTMYTMEKGQRTFIGTVNDPELPEEVFEEYKRRLKIY